VDDIIGAEKTAALKAREAVDAARKAAATASIFMALSLLIGAFIAPASAALEGDSGTAPVTRRRHSFRFVLVMC
jgi:hypothetical protein